MPPQIIAGRYRLEREVGRGGMGSVWLCRDEKLGRDVALKQVGGLPGESNLHLARALREARHSAALNHPNVVAIFDAIEEGDHVWLVMEYVASRTLEEIIRAEGPVPPRRAAALAAQVADGLAAAHAVGTVHRDVKPSNILVRDDDRALIADFGIARTVGQEQLTRSGLVTGTPVYFAPELARGGEPTPASDVWALGVTLYAAVQGEPPFPDQANAIALLNTIASQTPPAPARAGELAEPIAHMMDPDPATRWSMARVAAELHQVADAAPVEGAADVPPATPIATPAAPPAAPPDAPPAASPDAEPVAPDPEPVTPRTRPTPVVAPAFEEPRRGRALLVGLAALALAVVGVGGWALAHGSGQEGSQSAAGSSASAAPSSKPSRSPSAPASTPPATEAGGSDRPSPEASSPATSSSPDGGSDGGADGSAAGFVVDYYSHLPDDTDTSWDMLSAQAQQRIGKSTFDGFWATIDAVRVEDAELVSDEVVQVRLTYSSGGRTEQESRQLQVEQTDDGFLISADLGAV